MARAIARCTCATCGAKFERVTTKMNSTLAAEWVAWAEETITECPDCWKARQRRELLGDRQLPALTGSTKQVAWAEEIREKMIQEVAKELRHLHQGEEKYRPIIDKVLDLIFSGKTSAAWYIDHRGSLESSFLIDLIDVAPDVVAQAEKETGIEWPYY